MGRASGKATRRPPRAGEHLTEDERKDIGQSPMQDPAGSPIPGLTGNILNYETPRQAVPVPEPREQNAGWMAHGVPPGEDTTEERAVSMRGGPNLERRAPVKYEAAAEKPIAVPVYIIEEAGGSRALRTMATNKMTITPAGSTTNPSPQRVTSRDETRLTMYVQVETASVNGTNPTPSQPAVPATTVAQQNVNSYPVSVAISANGATISNVSVNGVTVGTAAGTYTVPAFGAISISYTVATPTWVWSYAGAQVTVVPAGIRVDHEVSTLDVGLGALIKPSTGYQEIKGCQDELFMISADTNNVTVNLIYVYELAGAL